MMHDGRTVPTVPHGDFNFFARFRHRDNDSKGLPPEYSETLTPPVVYRFFQSRVWIYQAGTTQFGLIALLMPLDISSHAKATSSR